MVQFDPQSRLPSSQELPCSDDTPVDNELQDTVPGLLKLVLAALWHDRNDWFFGVDMGVYADTKQPYRAIVPDGFLSLNVPRFRSPGGRLSYVLWEENIMPILVLEVVSQTYRGEYKEKLLEYANLGVLYYVVYNPDRRRKRDPLEVYKLTDRTYERQPGEPVWMPEIGLGIGRAEGSFQGWSREWLYWFNQSTERYPTSEEQAEQEHQRAEQEHQRAEQERQRAEQERQRADQEHQRAERLSELLRARGLDPETLL